MPSFKEFTKEDDHKLENVGSVTWDTEAKEEGGWIHGDISKGTGSDTTEENRETMSKNFGLYFWSYKIKVIKCS